MANVGEFFPMQFAMGILSLQAQQREAAARTQQLREAQAQQAAIEQQRLQLAQIGQAQEARHQAFAESQAAQAEELNKQKLAFQVKEHEDMLKNQDADNLAKLAKGEDAFFRAAGPQPPPEALEGPEVTTETGEKQPSYRMSKINIPGQGTFYHKIEDTAAQQRYDEAQAKIKLETSRAVAAYQQAQYNRMRASNWNSDVNDARGRKITKEEIDSITRQYNLVKDRAAKEIALLADSDKQEDMDRAARLRADPTFYSSESEKNVFRNWGVTIEAYSRNLAAGIDPSKIPNKSFTGQHPDDIDRVMQWADQAFGHNIKGPTGESTAVGVNTGGGYIERPIIIGEDGKITYPDLRGFTTRPQGGFSTERTIYNKEGKVIGTEIRNPAGKVLSATGTSPFAKQEPAAAVTPAAASPADNTAALTALRDSFKRGEISADEYRRRAAAFGIK